MPTTTIKRQGTIDFVEVLPSYWKAGQNYPVLIFFHGIDGRRSVEYLLSNEIPRELQDWTEAAGLVLLCPQTSTYFGREHIDACILAAAKVTTSQIRLITGLSFGGGGLLSVLSIPGMAGLFKAAVVVCGVRSNELQNCELAKSGLPVLFFHASGDPTVNINDHGLKNYNDLLLCSPKAKPLFITLPLDYHWIWGQVYDLNRFYPIDDGKQNQSVLSWMMSKTTQAAPLPSFYIELPPDFSTSKPAIKVTGKAVGEDWDRDGARWEVVIVPEGVNKWHVITMGGGWIEFQGVLPKPGKYRFRLHLKSKTGRLASKDIEIIYSPEAAPIPDKPIFTEFDFEGKHFIIYEDKTRKIE